MRDFELTVASIQNLALQQNIIFMINIKIELDDATHYMQIHVISQKQQ